MDLLLHQKKTANDDSAKKALILAEKKKNIERVFGLTRGTLSGIFAFEGKILASILITLLLGNTETKVKLILSIWACMGSVEALNAVLNQARDERRLHYRVLVFSLIETALNVFFLILVEPSVEFQQINFSGPFKPIKELFSYIYLSVVLFRTLFRGIVVFNQDQD